MSIHDRLDDLEQRLEKTEICPECGYGSGKIKLLPMRPDGTPHPPPEPCKTCGRTPRVIRIRKIILPSPRATADADAPID